ncbi:MAG TPA: hypothetical protein PLR71_06445 [Deltaproteobacteria bacterium]|nr:hypothetical protein [Deltaproteobacteria bacterium]HQI81187.1 hypothetical protein [Deltaproteobacteria bacterium]
MSLEVWPDCPRDESAREIARILQSRREAAFLKTIESQQAGRSMHQIFT